MKALCICSGVSLVLLALVVSGLALIAIIDPVSTKMADDNDPFGPPPSRLSSLSMFGASVAIGIGGVYLIRRSFHPRSDATNIA